MDIIFKTRQLYLDELRILKILKHQQEKQKCSKIKFYYYVITGLLGAICTYIAEILPDSFWTFLFGTIAVFSFGFIVFTPYEIFKHKKRHRSLLQQFNTFVDRGTVDTCIIHSKRIAVAEEFEDEGDLYIIEYDTDRLIYLWDNDHNLRNKFPCFDFEIYDDTFYRAYGRQIYPLSGRIKPLTIDKKSKWNYMKKFGSPGHLETENKNFDKIIEEYNNCA